MWGRNMKYLKIKFVKQILIRYIFRVTLIVSIHKVLWLVWINMEILKSMTLLCLLIKQYFIFYF